MKNYPRSPLAVIDWNFIQSTPGAKLRRNTLHLPTAWDFLIPESAVHEALEKGGVREKGGRTQLDAKQSLRKLANFCLEFRDRVWLAKTTGRICILAARRMKDADLVAIESSLRVRKNIRAESDWAELVNRGRTSDGHRHYLECEAGFLDHSDQFRDFLRSRNPSGRVQQLTDPKIAALVRDAVDRIDLIPPQWLESLGLTDARVAHFPDIVTRWWRLLIWYYLRRANNPLSDGEAKKFSNCFADADAVFLASFTGFLLTGDQGQQRAARALRPDVEIWAWEQHAKRIQPVK